MDQQEPGDEQGNPGKYGRIAADRALHRGCRATVLAAVLSALLAPVEVHAAEQGRGARETAVAGAPRRLSEDDLQRVWAKGFADRLFARMTLWAAGGNGVEVFGDTAMLRNPLAGVDADALAGNGVFSPANPAAFIGRDGSVLVRLQDVGTALAFDSGTVRNIRGASMGSMSVRGIDRRGTTVFISRH